MRIPLRLDTALTSYGAQAGTPFEARVIAPVLVRGRVVLPAGTIVHGTVRRSVRVGMGLVRERALLDLDFEQYELADGRRFPLRARLSQVENARETVDAQGRIRGILAANNPQSFVQGVWFRPGENFLEHSAIGLTGASGRIATEYSMGPLGAAALLAIRFAIFRMPEPEIRLPRGAELQAVLTGIRDDAPSFDPIAPSEATGPLADWVRNQPYKVERPNGEAADDIANVFFAGSREQVIDAFEAAGWAQADPMDRASLARAYKAYMSQSGYRTAPVCRLLYRETEPDMVFQKSLNTLSKRHHIRLWSAEFEGQTIWIGAATQDIGIALDSKKMAFSHKIDLSVDTERSKVVGDMTFAGCAESVGYVGRDEVVRHGDGRKTLATDGKAAIVSLGRCIGADHEMAEMPRLPGSQLSRSIRRGMLETRNYLLRGNAYYWAYRAVTYRRPKAAADETVAVFRPPAHPRTDLPSLALVEKSSNRGKN